MIILVNFSKKIIMFMNEKQIHSNDTIYDGSTSTLTQSGTVDKDCNDSSFFDTGCDSRGGDGGATEVIKISIRQCQIWHCLIFIISLLNLVF